MAALRGERFHVDLSSDDEEQSAGYKRPQPTPSFSPAFVKDIQEKPISSQRQPRAPEAKPSINGFPTHKKRTGLSRFKQARAAEPPVTSGHAIAPAIGQSPPANGSNIAEGFEKRERREIDAENRARLASLSDVEIEQERRELMQGLSPALIERLLQRASIDEAQQPRDFPGLETATDGTNHNAEEVTTAPRKTGEKRVAFAEPQDDGDMPEILDGRDTESEADEDSPEKPETTSHDSDPTETAPPASILSDNSPHIHFPRPPPDSFSTAPTLDPTSDNFLEDLHTKYFPDLPTDPSKLAWLSDPSASAAEQTYTPSAIDVPVSAFRFSFTGKLIPPSASLRIPTTSGMHHHGDAPASAGYTIGELAHLARSSFPSQRCMAFQTLGRMLYRLGKGEFAIGEDGQVIQRGLWACVREGRVLETLQEEVGRKSGHMSAKAHAVDALWLWRLGGGVTPIEIGAN